VVEALLDDRALPQFRGSLGLPMEDSIMRVAKIETLGQWGTHIDEMDEAVAANDTSESIRAWRRAYSAALSHPSWLGLFAVATAALRIGTLPSLTQSAASLSRESYWIAFFRARQQRSLTGVLRTAEAFAVLGDRDAAERCVRVADQLVSNDDDAAEVNRVRDVAKCCGRRGASGAAECTT